MGFGSLVNSLPPSPPLFSDLRILKDFKSNEFGSADCKGVTRLFFGSADSKEVTGLGLWIELPRELPRAGGDCSNEKREYIRKGNIHTNICQWLLWRVGF
jgi:hypothetical protein